MKFKGKIISHKWYLYALNAIEGDRWMIIMRMFDDNVKALSLFNFLRYVCGNMNIINNDSSFPRIIDDLNDLDDVLKTLKTHRNNWDAHIGSPIVNDYIQKKYPISNVEYHELLIFCKKVIEFLYFKILGEKPEIITVYQTTKGISKFVDLLNDDGDLE